MAKQKPVRLSKAARQVNLAISSVVEFLANKGHEIESSPNTKLSPEMYSILLDEFKADIKVKEKSKVKVEKEEKQTIVLQTIQKKEEEKAPEVVPVPTPIKVEEVKVEVVEVDDTPKLKIIDKIDLNPKKKEVKEPEKEVVQEKESVEKVEPKKESTPETPAPVKEVKKEEVKAKPEEIETVRIKPQILAGPTVLRKIVLPPKPVASSSEDRKTKRKRKRIEKPTTSGTGNRGGQKTGGAKRGKPRSNKRTLEYSPEQIQKEIKETLAKLNSKGKSSSAKLRRQKRDEVAKRRADQSEMMELEKSVLKLTEFVTVSELSTMMDVSTNEIISACMSLGMMVSINQRIDAETITLITEEFGYEVNFVSAEIQESIEIEEDDPADLVSRPPIVTVMGHVDHGKTSLLDYIRSASVIAGEAGGITQHIGAYNVTLPDGAQITFLDTPGHEAFTAMRARGAQVTDLVIIVIAADDSVMPQTREAINHAKAAGVPMIFAFNKIDKPGVNVDKVKEELSQMDILVEDWGGKYQSQEISAKHGTNITELMEKVMLEAEMLELKANPNKRALGTIIESTLDKGRGYLTTLLVSGGTLHKGDILMSGKHYGKVKAIFDEKGNSANDIKPGFPASILGIDGSTDAGDAFHVMENEKEARTIANKRAQLQREQNLRTTKHTTLDDIGRRIALGEFNELNLIIKGDVSGSIEALADSLEKLSTEKVEVKIIHKAVGQIIDSDILLASASDAIVIGFQVRPSLSARKMAEREEIEIKLYSVIYDVIDDARAAMEGMLSAKIEERIVGTVEVREVFKISKVGTIAGCFVIDGKIIRGNPIRVIREGVVVHTGKLGSLKRFKDDVKEVTKGYECGLNIDRFNDIKEGDQIESFEEVEVKQKL